MQKGTSAYLQTQVTTTSQGEILLMLYDGAIKFLTNAKTLIAARDMAGKGNAISRALDIVNELDSTLNMEKGGELSRNLHTLYLFCNKRLLMANLKASPEILDEVITILTNLRSAYAAIATLPEAMAAGEEVAATQNPKGLQGSRSYNRPMPPQAGAPAPGVGVGLRAQSLYARKSAELLPTASAPTVAAPTAPEVSAELGSPASPAAPLSAAAPVAFAPILNAALPVASTPVTAPASIAPAATGAKAVPTPPTAPLIQAPLTIPTPPPAAALPAEPAEPGAMPPPSFAGGTGFGGKRAMGADIYRKFAGQ